MILFFLLGLHHLGDSIQPNWLLKAKEHSILAHWSHAMVWATIVSLGLFMFGIYEPWKFVFLVIGHFYIDYSKYILLPTLFGRKNWYTIIDQALHYVQIIIVTLL